MSKWLLRVGISLVVAALISVSPILDLLPVGGWYSLIHLFSRNGEGVFYKVVPASSDYTTTIILAATGISLIIIGKLSKTKIVKHTDTEN